VRHGWSGSSEKVTSSDAPSAAQSKVRRQSKATKKKEKTNVNP
jgi:hypothetical protein